MDRATKSEPSAEKSAGTRWRYLWKDRRGGEGDKPRTRESTCSVNSPGEGKNTQARSGSARGCFPWRGRAGPHGRAPRLRFRLWTTCTWRYVQIAEERATRPGRAGESPPPVGFLVAASSGRRLLWPLIIFLGEKGSREALWHSQINPLNQPARRRFWD